MAVPLQLSLGLIGLLALGTVLAGKVLSLGESFMSSAQGQPTWGIESTPMPPRKPEPPSRVSVADYDRYRQVIERTRSMIHNPEAV